MKFFKFEGTAEELQVAYSLFADDVVKNFEGEPPASPQPTPIPPLAEPEKTGELTEEAVVTFLTRSPLPKNQAAIIKTLLNAEDDHGLKSSELAESIGCPIATVKSSMRAFGKRVAHTKGWPSGLKAFKWKWLGSEMSYRLHPAVRAVLMSGRVKL